MTHGLTDEERARLAEDGCVVRRGAVPIATVDGLIARLSERSAASARAHLDEKRAPGHLFARIGDSPRGFEVLWDVSGPSLLSLPAEAWERRIMRAGHGLHLADEVFRDACMAPALAAPLVDAVRARVGDAQVPVEIVVTAVIYKQPRSSLVQFGWHQDSAYYPTEPPSLVNAFVALDDMDEESGCLHVAPGSHRRGLDVVLRLEPSGFKPAGGRDYDFKPPRSVAVRLARGDVLFADGLLYHASGPNRAPRPRRAFLVHAKAASSTMAPTSFVAAPPGGFMRLPPCNVRGEEVDMPNVNAMECQMCGASLQGRQPVRVGDQVFCSKACADRAMQSPKQPTERPQR